MAMRWVDLLFMHWPVAPEALRPLVPAGLELDTFEGEAWLGVVPFVMEDVRPRFVPGVPGVSSFPELNLRTYASHRGVPGVWFFSLDAASPLAVRLARAGFFLPYFDAAMTCRHDGGEVVYLSRRTHRGAPAASFAARYRAAGEPSASEPGTLLHFLTERYCLYSADGRGRLYRGDIRHRRWRLAPAECSLDENRMTEQIGVRLPEVAPLLHAAEPLEVVACWPRRV